MCKNWYSIGQTMSVDFKTPAYLKYPPLCSLNCYAAGLWRPEIQLLKSQFRLHKGNMNPH